MSDYRWRRLWGVIRRETLRIARANLIGLLTGSIVGAAAWFACDSLLGILVGMIVALAVIAILYVIHFAKILLEAHDRP